MNCRPNSRVPYGVHFLPPLERKASIPMVSMPSPKYTCIWPSPNQRTKALSGIFYIEPGMKIVQSVLIPSKQLLPRVFTDEGIRSVMYRPLL